MTAARISPAASLLRNSKLFALPPAIALPTPEPSSEPVPSSDTATTVYPTRQAIETPLTSLPRGDWGLKRSLPLKSTTKSGSPSVRLNRGIDTREHIADFDSAADHVLTLKKFHELNQAIQLLGTPQSSGRIHHGVFRKEFDNTTNTSDSAPAQSPYSGVWPSLSPAELQKDAPTALKSQIENTTQQSNDGTPARDATRPRTTRRWRYEGPSLVNMSGMEFDQFINTLDATKRKAFRDAVRQDLLPKKRRAHAVKAQDEGTVGDVDVSTIQVSEEEVSDYLRHLRQQPAEFGRLIATFLDLPEGPYSAESKWRYGRDTLAAASYQDTGPPKTHPSAGLSYIHSSRWTQNDVLFGPQDLRVPVVARQVKVRTRGNSNAVSHGVAGFIVQRSVKGALDRHMPAFEPKAGGLKDVLRPSAAEVDEKGVLKYTFLPAKEYSVEGEKVVHNSLITQDRTPASSTSNRLPGSRVMSALTRNRPEPVKYRKRDDLSVEKEEDLDFLGETR